MSPYENRLRSISLRPCGFIAYIRAGQVSALRGLTSAPDDQSRSRWTQSGLSNVNIFCETTSEHHTVFVYFDSAHATAEQALSILLADPWFTKLAPHLTPHPRAAKGKHWLPIELINVIGPTLPVPTDPSRLVREGFITRLKPDCELTYRTLHQTNWPGVVDQMRRSQRRSWITFLIELGEELWLLTYSEYLGQDSAADDALMAADPVTQRWWRHTEPCLDSISPLHASWTPMDSMTAPRASS